MKDVSSEDNEPSTQHGHGVSKDELIKSSAFLKSIQNVLDDNKHSNTLNDHGGPLESLAEEPDMLTVIPNGDLVSFKNHTQTEPDVIHGAVELLGKGVDEPVPGEPIAAVPGEPGVAVHEPLYESSRPDSGRSLPQVELGRDRISGYRPSTVAGRISN